MDELFENLPCLPTKRPFKVGLPFVQTPSHHYLVRWWLLDRGWIEFEEWMIAYTNSMTGIYEVWFRDLRKAILFKLSFTLDNSN